MIHSQLLDSFYLSAEQLENSPSRQDGIDRDTEINLRIYGCELIQEAGILLGFHQVVMATGQVLFHRFYCKRSMKAFNVKKVAATALWVGAKLEEVPEVSKHPRELQEKVMVTLDRCTARREMPDAAKLPVLEPGTKEYEEFRRSLIRYETEMLKAFGFITNLEHPHRLILNYIQVLGIPNAIAQLVDAGDESNALHSFAQHAWNVANDSLRTTLCVRFKGSVVACGIILYTARVLQVPLPADWWELFQVELRDAVEVAHALNELYLAPKARFIPVCHQLLPSKPPTPAVGGGGIKVVLGATPLIGATPELGAARPGGKPLDPSVRRPLAASGSTPNLVVAAANGTAPGPSPQAAAAPGSARKRSRSRSPLDDGRKRQQVDSSSSSQQQQQPGLPPLAPSSQQQQQALLQQQAQAAIAAIAAGKERDASRDREQQRASSRHGTSGGGGGSGSRRRTRSRSRSRERCRSRSRERRRSRSRERDGRRRRSRSRSRERDSRRRRGSRSRSRERRERERHRGQSAERAGPARVDDGPPRSGAAGRDRGSSRDVRSFPEAKQEQPSQKLPPPASPGGSMPLPPPPAKAAAAMDGDSGKGAERGNGTGNGQQAAVTAAADNAAGGEQQQQQQPAKAKPVAVRKKPAAAVAAGPEATASPAADAEPKSTS